MKFIERDASGQSHWRFACDCGAEINARINAVRSGNTVSCGCQKIESASRHGMSRTPEYRAWRAMLDRCENPRDTRFENYGKRGITVCDRWHTFENFIADMGMRPSANHSLDRYPDNDDGYKPENCRWATWHEQANNRRPMTKRGH